MSEKLLKNIKLFPLIHKLLPNVKLFLLTNNFLISVNNLVKCHKLLPKIVSENMALILLPLFGLKIIERRKVG